MVNSSYFGRALDVCLELEGVSGRRPRPYQVEAIAWAIRGSCLLALDMGLGKTYCALAAARALKPRHLAIVTPTSVKSVWLDELRFLFGRVEVLDLRGLYKLHAEVLTDGPKKKYDPLNTSLTPDVYLLGHDVVAGWGRVLGQKSQHRGLVALRTKGQERLERATQFVQDVGLEAPDMVIVDESHIFGGPKSERTSGLLSLCSHAERVILLSGTPLAGGIERLYTQLLLTSRGSQAQAWGNYYSFLTRYCGAQENAYGGLTPTGATNTAELKERTKDLVLTKTRHEVSSTLPKDLRQRVSVFLDEREYRKVNADLEGLMKKLSSRGGEKLDKFLEGEVARVISSLAKFKVPVASELIAQVARSLPPSKVLVWVWFRATGALLSETLGKDKDLSVHRVDGSMTEQFVQSAVDQWEATPRPAVLIATIAKLGTGYDRLARCCHDQVVVEIPWLPETLEQALSRLIRLNQTAPQVTTRLVTLQVPFEISLCDRVLSRSLETDSVLGTKGSPALAGLLRGQGDANRALRSILDGLEE